MKRLSLFAFLPLAAVGLIAAASSNDAKIQRALLAGPSSIRANATVFDMGAKGKMIVLRKGTNGYSCYVGAAGVGNDPFCANEAAMQWAGDWMSHKPAPTNTKPGVIYMLLGGTDWSASDPWATKGTPIHEPPHWMILYPKQAGQTYETSGISKTIKNDGAWIMWSGTPYAHLMINQKP